MGAPRVRRDYVLSPPQRSGPRKREAAMEAIRPTFRTIRSASLVIALTGAMALSTLASVGHAGRGRAMSISSAAIQPTRRLRSVVAALGVLALAAPFASGLSTAHALIPWGTVRGQATVTTMCGQEIVLIGVGAGDTVEATV